MIKMLTSEIFSVAKQILDKVLTWGRIDELLYREFKTYNKNDNVRDVAYKVVLLDKLYNCNLKMDVQKVAEVLVHANIDDRLEKEDPVDIVEDISKLYVQGGKRLGLVFTSKYCHFHQPHKFPIYDSFAKYALSKLLGEKLVGYREFKSGIDRLISESGLSITYKQMDEYLWLYGQWLCFKEGKEKKLANEIKNVIKSHRELFMKLSPI